MKTQATPDILAFLRNPVSYPHKPDNVTIVQTHASWVALVKPWVYKLKKPVDFGFMDFTTLEKRKRNAYREVKLNRRLAPEIYKGVVPVVQDYAGRLYLADDEQVPEDNIATVDYAVKMWHLEPEYFFKARMRENNIEHADLDRIIDKLTCFYKKQQPPEAITEFGRPEHIRDNTQGNFTTLYDCIGDTLSQPAFDAIKYYTERFFECNEALFYKRMKEKRILDCHGDLHLSHIHMHPDRLSIYDCIEFNDGFRYIDVANDIAFLTMDLDFYEQPTWGHYITRQMEKALEDRDLSYMADFYKVYRACVRGKVESLQCRSDAMSNEAYEDTHLKARKHLALALRYSVAASDPLVLIVMGNIASGKSTLAGHLADILNATHINSDVVRKTMAGWPADKPLSDDAKAAVYASGYSDKVYEKLVQFAQSKAENNELVIIDATFGRPERRQQFKDTLTEKQFPFSFVELSAPEATIKERLKERAAESGQASDARLEDFEKLFPLYMPPDEVEQQNLIRINSTLSANENLTRILKKLVDKRI